MYKNDRELDLGNGVSFVLQYRNLIPDFPKGPPKVPVITRIKAPDYVGEPEVFT